MAFITLEELKTQLSLEGVSYDLDDSQLELLLNNIKNELAGYTNAPLSPTTHKVLVREFDDNMVELDYYPVSNVCSCKVGSLELTSDDYAVDESLGIVYFNQTLKGFLVCEYCSCVSDTVMTTIVNPLVFDMVKYRLTNNFTDNGAVSSVKEGDVSVNYDTSSSLGNLIWSRINNLKNSYSIRIKVL